MISISNKAILSFEDFEHNPNSKVDYENKKLVMRIYDEHGNYMHPCYFDFWWLIKFIDVYNNRKMGNFSDNWVFYSNQLEELIDGGYLWNKAENISLAWP